MDSTHLKKTLLYEKSAPAVQIHGDIAVIREIDITSERKARRLAWVSPFPLIAGVVLAFAVPDPTGSPIMIGLGLLTMIIILVIRGRVKRTDFENRRYELVDGLLRTLDLAEGSPVTVRLMLGPDKKVSSKGGTDRYETPWLHIEASLADGLSFHLDRTSFKSVTVTTRRRGKTRVTTTTTSSSFVDQIGVRYAPGTFPQLESAGAQIADQLRFPEFMAVQNVVNTPGELTVTARCNSKWDAGKTGGQSIDAVALTAVMLAGLYAPLGRKTPADPGRAGALPAARRRVSTRGAGALSWVLRVAAVLVLCVAGIFAWEYNKSRKYVESSRYSLKYRQGKLDKATPGSAEARSLKESVATRKQVLQTDEALASKRLLKLAASGGLGLLLAAASVWASRRRKEDQPEEAPPLAA